MLFSDGKLRCMQHSFPNQVPCAKPDSYNCKERAEIAGEILYQAKALENYTLWKAYPQNIRARELEASVVVDVRDLLRAVMDFGENDFRSVARGRL